MRNLVVLSAVLATGLASPIAAQEINTSDQRLEMIGEAPAACVLGQPSVRNAVNANFALNDAASGTIGIAEFVNMMTAETVASSIDLEFPVTCNAAHNVTLRSTNGGMLRSGAVAQVARAGTGFREFVAYDLGLAWAGQQLEIVSEANGAQIDAGKPAKGDLVLRVATPAGAGPLVAGQYSDAIIIEFNAGI